jgi:uncharacterized repeat protein (TIGR01451 family)
MPLLQVWQVYAASDLNMTLVVSSDGSAPWDATSYNTGSGIDPGNDSSATNGIVRAMDTITYNWRVVWNTEAPQDTTITHTLPANMEWTSLPASCLTSWVSPISSISWDKRTITCNLGNLSVSTLYSVFAWARLLGGLVNNDTIVTNASVTASNGSGSITSNTVTTTVTSTVRIELEKNYSGYLYYHLPNSIVSGPSGEPGRLIPYTIALYARRGSEPMNTGNITLTDRLRTSTGASISGALLYTWWRYGAPAACSVYGTGYSIDAFYPVPYGSYTTPSQWRAGTTPNSLNSVPNSGTISCSQAWIGGDVTLSISWADVSLANYPTEFVDYFDPISESRKAISIDKKYFWTYAVHLWVPLSTISSYGGTLSTLNTIMGSGGTSFDPDGISGWSNYGTGLESTTNNVASYTLTAPIVPSGTIAEIATLSDYSHLLNKRNSITFAWTGLYVWSRVWNVITDYFNQNPTTFYACAKVDPSQLRFTGRVNYDPSRESNLFNQVPQSPAPANTSSSYFQGVGPYAPTTATSYLQIVEYSTDDYISNIRDDTCSNSEGTWLPISNTGMLNQNGWVKKIRTRTVFPATNSGSVFAIQYLFPEFEVLPQAEGTRVGLFGAFSTNSGATWRTPTGASTNPADINYALDTTWLHRADMLTVTTAIARVSKTTVPSNIATVNAGATITYNLTGSLTAAPGSTPVPTNLVFEDILPNGLTYISGSTALDPGYPMGHPSGSGYIVRWTVPTLTNSIVTPIQYTTRVWPSVPNSRVLQNIVTISTPLDISNINLRQSSRSVTVNNINAFPISKTVIDPVRERDQPITYSLQYVNQSLTDVFSAVFIDIFPYNGDSLSANMFARSPASIYTWSLTLTSYSGSNSEIFEFSSRLPSLIHEDPCHVSNISLWVNAWSSWAIHCVSLVWWVSGNGATKWCHPLDFGTLWCPANMAEVTATRIIVPSAISVAPTIYSIPLIFTPTGNNIGNIYTNHYGARVTNTDLFARSLPVPATVVGGSIGDRVWLDSDRDGVDDLGESGMSGVTVSLSGTDFMWLPVTWTTTTNSSWNYLFSELRSGTYELSLSVIGPYVATYDADGTGTLLRSLLTLPRWATITTQDFWLALGSNLSLSGIVWYDADTDGTYDSGEYFLSWVVLTLSGTDILSNSITWSTLVDGSGAYIFSWIPDGTYEVRVTTRNMALSGTYDADDVGTLDTISGITLSGSSLGAQDFGYVFPASSIGDTVWYDADSDGVYDSGERVLSGVTLSLSWVDSFWWSVSGSTITNSSGVYIFPWLLPGNYTIIASGYPSGMIPTYDADGTGTVSLAAVSLDPGEDDSSIDFGYVYPAGSIGDSIWEDSNSDGIKDFTEWGIPSVGVTLSGTDIFWNSVYATTVSSLTGYYNFGGLPPGNYSVTLSGVSLLMEASYDADGISTLHTSTLTLSPGSHIATEDFGYFYPLGSIGDTVWHDTDGDGVVNGGEQGIASLQVELSGTDFAGRSVLRTTTTDASGLYSFTWVIGGSYTVTVSWLSPTLGATYDADGTGSLHTIWVSLISRENNLNTDFGYRYPVGTVWDYVWYDRNANGIYDVGEMGIQNINISLSWSDQFGGVIRNTVTDTNGYYTFLNVLSWSYLISLLGGMPADMFATYDLDGTGSLDAIEFTLDDWVSRSDIDFAYSRPYGRVSGTVWQNSNADTVIDWSESRYANVYVRLTGTDFLGNPVSLTGVTSSTWFYIFDTVLRWTYTVTVLSASLPSTLLQANYDPDGLGSLHSVGVGLTSDYETRENVDFGYMYPTHSLAGVVYLDANANHIKELAWSDLGIQINTITLSGTNILWDLVNLTTSTDSSGNYNFSNLLPGNYTVAVTTPIIGTSPFTDIDGLWTPHASSVTLGWSDIVDIDFGYTTPLLQVTGIVWKDQDSNSEKWTWESVFSWALVTLSGTTIFGATITMTRFTNDSGRYNFGSLYQGNYSVSIDASIIKNLAWESIGITQTFDQDGISSADRSSFILTNDRLFEDFGYLLNQFSGPGGGGGGGGWSPVSSGIPIATPPKETEEIRNTPPKNDTPPNNIKPPESVKNNLIQDEYAQYLKAKKRLAALIEEENTAGKLAISYPKILPQTGKAILSRVKKMVNAKLSLDAPEFKKWGDTLESYLENLPKEDRSRDEYIVTPSNGMITPINTVQDGTSDYKKLVSGREIDVNKYLKTGVVTYPGTNNTWFWGIGNTVIFGHSSYWKSDSGRYKTHFQKIIELEEGEEIWVYKKQWDGSYKRYRYVATESYEVKPSDVSILDPGIGKNLTLFTCTPIGGITGRWVIQAKYLDEEKISLENKLYGKLLTSTQNKEIKTYFQSLKSLSINEKKSNLEKKYFAVSTEKHTAFTEYFLMQIAKIYTEAK